MGNSREDEQNRKSPLIWRSHVTMTKKTAYISNEKQLQIHSLTFFHNKKSLLPATSILSRSPMLTTLLLPCTS